MVGERPFLTPNSNTLSFSSSALCTRLFNSLENISNFPSESGRPLASISDVSTAGRRHLTSESSPCSAPFSFQFQRVSSESTESPNTNCRFVSLESFSTNILKWMYGRASVLQAREFSRSMMIVPRSRRSKARPAGVVMKSTGCFSSRAPAQVFLASSAFSRKVKT